MVFKNPSKHFLRAISGGHLVVMFIGDMMAILIQLSLIIRTLLINKNL